MLLQELTTYRKLTTMQKFEEIHKLADALYFDIPATNDEKIHHDLIRISQLASEGMLYQELVENTSKF